MCSTSCQCCSLASLWCAVRMWCHVCCRRELLATLEQLEADEAVRGVIWASGLKRDVFTAGNDLKVPLIEQNKCACSPAAPMLQASAADWRLCGEGTVVRVHTELLWHACRSCTPPAPAGRATPTFGSPRRRFWAASGAARSSPWPPSVAPAPLAVAAWRSGAPPLPLSCIIPRCPSYSKIVMDVSPA